MIDFFVHLVPPLEPFVKGAAIFLHRTVEPNIPMLYPLWLLHDDGRIQLVGIEFPAEAVLARDELVHGKYHELDIIAVLVVLKLEPVVLISLPA